MVWLCETVDEQRYVGMNSTHIQRNANIACPTTLFTDLTTAVALNYQTKVGA